jgi:Leucine-rich repeat (LRR) protein
LNLRKLYLSNNSITELEGLDSLSHLELVDLSNNPIPKTGLKKPIISPARIIF